MGFHICGYYAEGHPDILLLVGGWPGEVEITHGFLDQADQRRVHEGEGWVEFFLDNGNGLYRFVRTTDHSTNWYELVEGTIRKKHDAGSLPVGGRLDAS